MNGCAIERGANKRVFATRKLANDWLLGNAIDSRGICNLINTDIFTHVVCMYIT